jgi:Ca-activated chloride channel homolog
VVLALDLSQSLTADARGKLRGAGRLVIDALRPEDRGAVLTFSNEVNARTTLTGDFSRLRSALEQSPGSGETALVDGVYAAMAIAESDADGRGLVIVFSDGEDTSSFLRPEAVLRTARGMEVVVYSVSIGKPGSAPFLGDLAELTSGRRLQTSSLDGLGVTFTQILEEFRWRHLLSFTPTGVAADGWHRLDVRVRRPGVTVRARLGYFVTGSDRR